MTILFFDLDGTLMLNPFFRVVFPTVSQQFGDAVERSVDEVFQIILAEHDRRLEHPFENDRARTMDWEDIFTSVAQQLGTQYTLSAEQLVQDHAAPPYTEAYDNAVEVLGKLKQGRRLVVSSMGLSKYQNPVMKALGLYDLFDDFLMPDTTGYLKIDREFYGHYLESSELRIHIGDRYDHDCEAPKSFGTKSILRLPDFATSVQSAFKRVDNWRIQYPERVAPDAIINHLEELPSVVKQLEKQHS